ncbi:MAG: hypothetical protein HY707_14120 [Ignavibacteriae bacterium]|nr:hypothetical protein [Ignavibacteriota bacterium]
MTESDVTAVRGTNSVEETLSLLWEKVHAATELISQLRETRRSLDGRVSKLEQEVTSLKLELQTKEQELKKLRTEYSSLLNSRDNNVFTQEEKENLKNKIRELIAKINSHL